MPLITPKTDWIAGDSVGFSDMNRIEGNILYLQNENKTINGTNTYTGASTFNSSLEVIGLTTISSSGITSSSASIDFLKALVLKSDSISTEESNIFVDINTDSSTGSAIFAVNRNINTSGTDKGLAIYRGDGTIGINHFLRGTNTHSYVCAIGGNFVVGSSTDNGSDRFQVVPDDDISVSFGRSKHGFISGVSDQYFISHYDNHNTTSYAFRMSDLNTHMNAPDTGSLFFAINNSSIASISQSETKFKTPLFKIERSITTQNMTFDYENAEASYRANNTLSAVYPSHVFYVANNTTEVEVCSFGESLIDLKKPVEALSGVNTDNATLKTKVVNIGTWNMSSGGGGSTSKSVAHGLTRSKIRKVRVVIENDSGATTYPLEYVPFSELSSTTAIPEGSLNVTATNVVMRIRSGGWWNAGTNTEFDGTQNRGYIEIDYEA